MLAFENFLLLMGVIFGLQFVDRSFGPVLPLYVAELGVARGARGGRAGVLFSIARRARRPSGITSARGCCARWTRADASSRAARVGGGRGGRCLVLAADAVGCCCPAAAVFGVGVGAAMTAAYTAAGGGHARGGARRRLRPAHERVARRAWRSARS